jgi:hypothetical protein
MRTLPQRTGDTCILKQLLAQAARLSRELANGVPGYWDLSQAAGNIAYLFV